MVARPAAPFRSANAGEFSRDAAGRVDVKQYYSAGLAYKNIEPVPQSGFRQMGGSWRMGTIPGAAWPRYVALTLDDGTALSGFFTAGRVDFFTEAGHVATVNLPTLLSEMLPDLDFYSEGRTIGVFHPQLRSLQLFLVSGLDNWTVSNWPYDPVPKADLGGVYAKTDDVWEMFIRWGDGTHFMTVVFNVNGELTAGVPFTDLSDVEINVNDGTVSDAMWDYFASKVKTALEGLPSLGPTVTVTQSKPGDKTRKLSVTLGGDLAGEEYQLSATVANTSEMSILPYHTQIGKTALEDLFSVARGWPGTADLVQDRMGYARLKAKPGATALSRIGEYFDLNAQAPTDNAARLDALRSQTSETILQLKESKYLLCFTDRGVYFANNRTIERNQPLNFVLASETGAQPNCKAFDLEGEIYYVAINPRGLSHADEGGNQLLSIIYDDVSTSYNAAPVSLLASHLVTKVIRNVRQRPEGDLDAAKGWLMRTDGRLVAAQIIRNQDISGFCEWIAASGGLVREIGIDGKNRLWLAVERGGIKSIELYDLDVFLQDAVTKTTDLAGLVSGLTAYEGQEVWAVADGYVLGPYTVAAGKIDLEDAYVSVVVGRWQPPRWESMPQVHVTRSDDVIFRPGRIHTAYFHIVDTTSIAVGANGSEPQNVSLLDANDLTNQPVPAKTRLLTVTGLTDFQEAPTLVVTQTRPGKLRIRDLAIGAKL